MSMTRSSHPHARKPHLLLAVAVTGALAAACSRGGDVPGDASVPFLVDAGAVPDATSQDAGESCVVRCGPSATCCGAGEECVVDRCRPACAGNRCGEDDAVCCAAGELCVGGACAPVGRTCATSRDCAATETCDPVAHSCIRKGDATCRVTLPSSFDPAVEWEWTDEEVFVTPLVVQLSDDQGDGRVDPRDVPDVVVVSRLLAGQSIDDRTAVRLTALSGDDGHVLWQSPLDVAVCPLVTPAAADLDGDGHVEIVTMTGTYEHAAYLPADAPRVSTCSTFGTSRLTAFDHSGAVLWQSPPSPFLNPGDAIAIGDIEGDGAPEIVVGAGVYDRFGQVVWATRDASVERGFGYDLDDDGEDELVFPTAIFPGTGGPRRAPLAGEGGYVAVGDVFGDAAPELVVSRWGTVVALDARTLAPVFGPFTDWSGFSYSGAPTIGDFDGDGESEFGVMMARGFQVFDANDGAPEDGYMRWRVTTGDFVASTGATLFDFDADGAVEVVFNDECHLQIRDGRTGALVWATENTSVTYWENPVVADVDGDGNAELVTIANSVGDPPSHCYGRTLPFSASRSYHGVRVFRDRLDHWVQTRAIWNQYQYYVDNVNDDGTIPARPARGSGAHDTFRVNQLIDREALTLAPDLAIGALGADTTACTQRVRLRARLLNRGTWGVPAHVPVSFFAAEDDQLLGTAWTSEPLLGGDSTWVELELASPPIDARDDTVRFYVRADEDGAGMGMHTECDEANNRSDAARVVCRDPI